jgi:hypothetical protein
LDDERAEAENDRRGRQDLRVEILERLHRLGRPRAGSWLPPG